MTYEGNWKRGKIELVGSGYPDFLNFAGKPTDINSAGEWMCRTDPPTFDGKTIEPEHTVWREKVIPSWIAYPEKVPSDNPSGDNLELLDLTRLWVQVNLPLHDQIQDGEDLLTHPQYVKTKLWSNKLLRVIYHKEFKFEDYFEGGNSAWYGGYPRNKSAALELVFRDDKPLDFKDTISFSLPLKSSDENKLEFEMFRSWGNGSGWSAEVKNYEAGKYGYVGDGYFYNDDNGKWAEKPINDGANTLRGTFDDLLDAADLQEKLVGVNLYSNYDQYITRSHTLAYYVEFNLRENTDLIFSGGAGLVGGAVYGNVSFGGNSSKITLNTHSRIVNTPANFVDENGKSVAGETVVGPAVYVWNGILQLWESTPAVLNENHDYVDMRYTTEVTWNDASGEDKRYFGANDTDKMIEYIKELSLAHDNLWWLGISYNKIAPQTAPDIPVYCNIGKDWSITKDWNTNYGKFVRKHIVTFKDYSGAVISEVSVSDNGSVAAPAAPARTDYVFADWVNEKGVSVNLKKITANTVLIPKYTYVGAARSWHDFSSGETLCVDVPLTAQEGAYSFSLYNGASLYITANNVTVHDFSVAGDVYISGSNVKVLSGSVGGNVFVYGDNAELGSVSVGGYVLAEGKDFYYHNGSINGSSAKGLGAYINAPGAKLAHAWIGIALVFGEGVGDGEVYMEEMNTPTVKKEYKIADSTPDPNLFINGGGSNSAYVKGSAFGKVVVDKPADAQSETVHVVLDKNTSVAGLNIASGAFVENAGKLGEINVSGKGGAEVVISGGAEKVFVTGDAKLSLENADVSALVADAQGANILVSGDSSVSEVSMRGKGVSVANAGEIGLINVAGANNAFKTLAGSTTERAAVSGANAVIPVRGAIGDLTIAAASAVVDNISKIKTIELTTDDADIRNMGKGEVTNAKSNSSAIYSLLGVTPNVTKNGTVSIPAVNRDTAGKYGSAPSKPAQSVVTPAKTFTQLTITNKPIVIASGENITFTPELLAGTAKLSGKTLTVKNNSKAAANASSGKAYTISKPAIGTYEIVVSYAGDSTYEATSATFKVIVEKATPALKPSPAKPAPATVYVNGAAKTFECYEINGYTYFKLVDVATAMKDTLNRFAIDTKFAIGGGKTTLNLKPGETYNLASSKLDTKATKSYASVSPVATAIYVNGVKSTIKGYFINSSSYYLIGDLQKYLGFAVSRDKSKATKDQPNGPITLTAIKTSEAALKGPASVRVNGVLKQFECYQINGYTYFKLVDVGTALKDTNAKFAINTQFYVGTTKTLNLLPGQEYDNTVTALNVAATNDYKRGAATGVIYVGSKATAIKGYFVNNGVTNSSYYKITDLEKELGFKVTRSTTEKDERGNGMILITG